MYVIIIVIAIIIVIISRIMPNDADAKSTPQYTITAEKHVYSSRNPSTKSQSSKYPQAQIKTMVTDFYTDFYAIDFETATRYRYSACALAIVHVVNDEIVDKRPYLFQPPGNDYDRTNVEIHHIMPSDTANAPTLAAYADEIYGMLNGANVIAHNASFDRSVLWASFEKHGLPIPEPREWHCTYALTGLKLNEACTSYKIEFKTHHDAMCDAEACANLYIKLATLARRTPAQKKQDRLAEIQEVVDVAFASQIFPEAPFFQGKGVVVTGVFRNFPEREYISVILEKFGASIKSSISKRVNIVICGELPGPKKMEAIEKLRNAGVLIDIWTEGDLIAAFDEIGFDYLKIIDNL